MFHRNNLLEYEEQAQPRFNQLHPISEGAPMHEQTLPKANMYAMPPNKFSGAKKKNINYAKSTTNSHQVSLNPI